MTVADNVSAATPVALPTIVNGGQNPTPDGGVDQKREAGLIFGAAS
jgi:hypothetical protein